jgi:hypothetical protein
MRSRGLSSPDRADAVLGCMMPARAGGFDEVSIRGVFVGDDNRFAPRAFVPRFTRQFSNEQGDLRTILKSRGLL